MSDRRHLTKSPLALQIGMFEPNANIVIVLTDGINLLDMAGPAAAFAAANTLHPASYRLTRLGFTDAPIVTACGLTLLPEGRLKDNHTIDTLLLPGGPGPRRHTLSDEEREQLLDLSARARRVVSICTGSFLLAQFVGNDAKRVTTHWRYAGDLKRAFPHLAIDRRCLFVKDGRVWTSAGVTAGIDLALALIREDLGSAVAVAVARELVVYLQRPGDQLQYAAPLAVQSGRDDMFADLVTWISAHLGDDLSVEQLAMRAKMSPRNFARSFKRATGQPPARFVEQLRLDVARQILAQGTASIDGVAATVGFRSADSFRRAFERSFGVPPSFYRAAFSTVEPSITT